MDEIQFNELGKSVSGLAKTRAIYLEGVKTVKDIETIKIEIGWKIGITSGKRIKSRFYSKINVSKYHYFC